MPDPRAEHFGTYEHCGPDGSCFRPKGHEGGCVPRPQLPEGVFIATGLRGPVTIPKLTVAPEDPPELDAEVIRRRVDAYTGPDHYRFTIDGIEYDAHWAHDTRRLLDENARLNAELAEAANTITAPAKQLSEIGAMVGYPDPPGIVDAVRAALAARDRTVEALSARLTAKNTELAEIGEGSEEWAIQVFHRPGGSGYYFHDSTGEDPEQDLADVLELLADGRDMAGNPIEHGPVSIVKRTVWSTEWETVEPAPEMPRPPAEEGDAEPDLTLIPAELIVRDPEICSGRPTMRGTRLLAEMIAGHLTAGTTWEELHEWYPWMPIPAAQERADGTDTSSAGSGRGTGAKEAQASDG